MPIQKFRTLEEAEKALWADEIDAAYLDRLRRLYELSAQLAPRSYPRGVFKYRTIEEAQAEAARWREEAIRRGREKA